MPGYCRRFPSGYVGCAGANVSLPLRRGVLWVWWNPVLAGATVARWDSECLCRSDSRSCFVGYRVHVVISVTGCVEDRY